MLLRCRIGNDIYIFARDREEQVKPQRWIIMNDFLLHSGAHCKFLLLFLRSGFSDNSFRQSGAFTFYIHFPQYWNNLSHSLWI